MKHYTKRPLEKSFIFRLYERDRELLRSAAAQREVSQSDFIRTALREKASRVLAGSPDKKSEAGVRKYLHSEAGSALGLRGQNQKSDDEHCTEAGHPRRCGQVYSPAESWPGVYWLSPCHNDRHPSLRVNPDKQVWYCDPCATGGDVIRFVELVEGVPFREALNILGIGTKPKPDL